MVDLPVPAGADNQRAGAFLDPAAEQVVQLPNLRGQFVAAATAAMFGGHEPREHPEPALGDQVVVKAAAERGAAVLDDAQAAALRAVLGTEVLQQDHAVSDALHVQIVIGGCHVVEHDDRAVTPGEELLERQDLPPVAQRIAGHEPQLRQRVEDDPGGVQLMDVLEDELGRRRQLDFGGVKHRVLIVGLERAFIRQ
jgi:hypothetical protein